MVSNIPILLSLLSLLLLPSQTTGFLFKKNDTAASEVCCHLVGCFQTSGVFSHLPDPSCVEDFGGVEMRLYTQTNINKSKSIDRYMQDIPSEFDPSVRTMFLIHGYKGDSHKEWMKDAKDELLKQGRVNVIMVDWQHGANSFWYSNSAANTRTVGAEVALIAERFKIELNVSPSDLWCVGFSLGAHACGFAGSRTKFARITGLDPAGPWFNGQHHTARLDRTDADFVDVIHCDGKSLITMGTLQALGHMDFYPNGGSSQPGCILNFKLKRGAFGENTIRTLSCSHKRAPEYWVESITNEGCFTATHEHCKNSRKLPGSCSPCSGLNCAMMGVHADVWYKQNHEQLTNSSALFYMETNSQYPYCII